MQFVLLLRYFHVTLSMTETAASLFRENETIYLHRQCIVGPYTHHTVLSAIFPSKPELARCSIDSESPANLIFSVLLDELNRRYIEF